MYSILGLAHKTLFVKLPEELLLYIISFNEASAVKIIQQQYRIMLKNKIKIFARIIRAGFAGGFDGGGGMGRICNVFYNKKLVPQKELINTFSRCDCCEKHKINRPTRLTNWVETEFHNTRHTYCACSCRHYSRMLCREINRPNHRQLQIE